MKILKSFVLALILLFFSFSLILARTCPPTGECAYYSCTQQLIYTQYDGVSETCPRYLTNGFCPNGYPSNDPCNNGGGGGGGGGGSVSTNIDSQVSDFFAFKTIDNFIPNLLQIALVFGAIIAFAFLIWGGIDYILSGGNQERIKTSKSIISNALAGLAILAAVWVIWRLVTYFLGLSDTLYGPVKFNLPKP